MSAATSDMFDDLGIVVVAAGRGSRSGLDGPKQYFDLCGKPVVQRTVETFTEVVDPRSILVVRHADDADLLATALGDDLLSRVSSVVGGDTRQASVLAGLQALADRPNPPRYVMIHDAARPFVSRELLKATVDALMSAPNHGVLPVEAISSTIKRIDGSLVKETVDRSALATAQTPQAFPLALVLDAHKKAAGSGEKFTDDASIFEWAGLPVAAIDGDPDNIKLTYPDDFVRAERFLTMNETASPRVPDIRTGHGYDVHRFVDGDHVHLCGVRIPHTRSLSGHSDADVGLHALTDALLATCGAGDIGDHFPPSDPKWKGAESHIFLTEAVRIVRDAGGTILNVDVTLICEAPKIGPHRQAMREKLADLCAIDVGRCSVKATTNEKMGFIGREEGMCAMATASVGFGYV